MHLSLSFEHATGDHSKELRSCLYMVQNYQFLYTISYILGGKWTAIDILFVYHFC